MNALKSSFDKLTLAALEYGPVRRLVRFLSYQNKRIQRREIEGRLRSEGKYGDEVLAGPFSTMKFPPPDKWISCRFEKIIGSYESELNPWLERIIREKRQYTDIVNPGAADGMFIIGLGRLFPRAKLWAFEIRDQPVGVLKESAALNGVSERLEVGGFCEPSSLSELKIGDAPFVLCDVEGYESVLLDPEKIPWLKTADIIVELHDLLEPGVSALIRNRFEATHSIDSVCLKGIAYDEYETLRHLTLPEIQVMTESDRLECQRWFFMESRN